MSGTVCCYSGCKKSYSTDKDVFFFKFPDEPKRRKKWMQNCGNLELDNLSDRQLRGKRICSDHFVQSSFVRPESRTVLNDNAVPILAKSSGKSTTAAAPSSTPGRKGKEASAPGASPARSKTPPVSTPSTVLPAKSRKRKLSTDETNSPVPSEPTKEKLKPQQSSPPSVVPSDTSKEEPTPTPSLKTRKSALNETPAVPDAKTYVTRRSQSLQKGAGKGKAEVSKSPARQLRGSRRSEKLEPKAPSTESPAATPPRSKRAVAVTAKKSAPVPVPEKKIEDEAPAAEEVVSSVVETKASGSKSPVKETEGKTKKRKNVLGKQSSPPLAKIAKQPTEPESTLPVSPISKKTDGVPSVTTVDPKNTTEVEVSEAVPVPVLASVTPITSPRAKKSAPKLKSPLPPPPPTVEQNNERSAAAAAISSVVAAVISSSPMSPTPAPEKIVPGTPKKKKKVSEKLKSPAIPEQAKEVNKSQEAPSSPSKKTLEDATVTTPAAGISSAPNKRTDESAAADAISSVVNDMMSMSKAPKLTEDKGHVDKPKKRKKVVDKPEPVSIPMLAKVKVEPQSSPQVKKISVSIEAMMAAVSSTKVPVTVTTTPAPKATATPSSQPVPKIVESFVQTKQKPPKPVSTPTVEIVRERPGDGSSMVVVVRQGDDVDNVDNVSEADSYDEYMYYDREFDFEHEEDTQADREFERFYASLKKFLRLPGKWTMGGVQWDPQGKRKVIIISEPEIPPNGRPCVKRCLQCFEDKSIRVFIDQMDMTDVFGMSCYAEKEDVAGLISRVADASSCCGVPEMVKDDLVHFPDVRKRNTSYFDPSCPGVIPNDAYDPICTSCKDLQVLLMESRENEKKRLMDRRIRSEEKQFQHPFGEALYSFFNDLADETDPNKPRKKRTKETFFRKFLHDTRYKVNGDTSRTERVYIEKPISVDSVSQSFQDIVSKLGFNMPNAKKRPSGGLLPRPSPSFSTTPRSTTRIFPGGTSNMLKMDRKLPMSMDHILPFTPGSSFTLDDGQEYELIGEVEPTTEYVEMKPTPSSQQQQQQPYEIIEVDAETMARLSSSDNQVVMLPEGMNSGLPVTTRIDANDPNLSQILKAINTSHGFKVS